MDSKNHRHYPGYSLGVIARLTLEIRTISPYLSNGFCKRGILGAALLYSQKTSFARESPQ